MDRIEDTYGDSARVTNGIPNRVYLTVEEGDETAELSLTRKQSKRLRKALKRAEEAAR